VKLNYSRFPTISIQATSLYCTVCRSSYMLFHKGEI